MRLQISSIFFLLHLIVSVAGEERCGLNCEHGECTLVSDKQDERAAMVQSGKMIEQCTCEDGYGGVACDILIQPCQSDGKCRNGRACQRDRESGELSCDCSDADGVSRFAGLMCRNPYTEYCADKYDPNESTSFCTNGGKCKSSFIGAQVAPGNTTINNAYSHLGCVCPKEFYGPHCEFLKYNRETSSETNEDTKGTSGGEEDQETNKDEGNINEPLPPSQVQDPEDENTQRNVSMIAGFSFLAAFAVLLVLLGMMSRYAARQEMLSGHLHINSTDIGHDYPPDYADGTISYGETDLYPQELCQPPAMSGGGE